jgi:hypothetical protein
LTLVTNARGEAWRIGDTPGRRWGALPAEAERALARWTSGAGAPSGERMSMEATRVGSVTVKIFPPRTPFGFFREPRALRSARWHFACLAVPTPRPLAALHRGRLGESVLVREFIPGRLLAETFGRDPASDQALPRFLAELRKLPWQHGDLHPRNLLWDETRWVLLDVDGLRHGLHPRRRVLLKQWICLVQQLEDVERAAALFRATQALAGALDRTRWSDVLAGIRQPSAPASIS